MSRFGIVPATLFDVQGIGPDEVAVACLMSTYADRNGWCWPGTTMMAQKLNRSQPWVVEAIQKLEARKVIEIRRQSGCSNRYRMMYDTNLSEPTYQPADPTYQPADRTYQPADTNTTKNTTINTPLNKAGSKGTRLAETWVITPAVALWCSTKFPAVDAAYEADSFREYWCNVAGARAFKLDWDRGFQQWVRKASTDRRYQPKPGFPPGRAAGGRVEQPEDRRARLGEAARRQMAHSNAGPDETGTS